ncbi:MAG: Hsp20/alpha crystallin family protein [Actinomycetes bacterium]
MPGGPDMFGQVRTFLDQGRLHVVVALPGVRAEDVEVHVRDDLLRIWATHPDLEPWEPWTGVPERVAGRVFARAVPLPAGVSDAAAEVRVDDGVLTVSVPLPAVATGG